MLLVLLTLLPVQSPAETVQMSGPRKLTAQCKHLTGQQPPAAELAVYLSVCCCCHPHPHPAPAAAGAGAAGLASAVFCVVLTPGAAAVAGIWHQCVAMRAGGTSGTAGYLHTPTQYTITAQHQA